MTFSLPLSGEYAPYFETYLRQLPAEAVLLPLLREQPAALRHLLSGIADDESAAAPTAPGKWSLKQIVGHLLDVERVFAYRAVAVARGEQTPLPSFDQDQYVANGHANRRSLADLLAEHAVQRASTVAFLAGLAPEVHVATGTVSGHPTTVRALAWIIAAHELHHHHLLAAWRTAQ